MAHELSSLGTRAGESQTVDDVVEARLELAQQFLTGGLRPATAGIEIARQLSGGDPVEPLHFLLLSQLKEIVGIPLAAAALLGAALLARRVRTADAAALARNLAGPLQAEFDAGTAREVVDRTAGSHAEATPLETGRPNVNHAHRRRTGGDGFAT